MAKKLTIEVQPHWYHELAKVRCWIDGFQNARGHNLRSMIPGEDTLRQIQVAIKDADK